MSHQQRVANASRTSKKPWSAPHPGNNQNLPYIPLGPITQEHRDAFGAAMRAEFGLFGAGFDLISKPYDHDSRKPTLTPAATVKLVSIDQLQENEDGEITVGEMMSSLGVGERRTSASLSGSERASEISEAAKIEYSLNMKIWTAEGARLLDTRSKQYGIVWRNIVVIRYCLTILSANVTFSSVLFARNINLTCTCVRRA